MRRTKQARSAVTMLYVAIRHVPAFITRDDVYERVRAALQTTGLEFATALPPTEDGEAETKPVRVARRLSRSGTMRATTHRGPYTLARSVVHREALAKALTLHEHNVTATAKHLGLPRSTIQSQLKRFGLARAR